MLPDWIWESSLGTESGPRGMHLLYKGPMTFRSWDTEAEYAHFKQKGKSEQTVDTAGAGLKATWKFTFDYRPF